MASLVGLPVVLGDQPPLKVSGRGNEIVGKGEPRSLAGEGLGEVAQLGVGFLPSA